MILAIVFAIAGIVFQFKSTQSYTVESYDRWAEEM